MPLESEDKKALSQIRLDKARSRRTDVDYGDFGKMDASDAEDSVKIAEDVIHEIENVRKKMF